MAAYRKIASGAGYDEQYRSVRPDGSVRWIEDRGFPVRDKNGEIYRVAGIAEDITERKQADEKLVEAKQEAERANQAKSEFLSRMSHELRTLLNANIGLGQLLEKEGRNPEEAENIDQVLKAGHHLLALINEVLDISGIEAGRETFSIEAVSLQELLPEMISLLRTTAAARNVTLHESAADCYLLADLQRLKQVLLNLLSNAIKYNCEGGGFACRARSGA